MRLHAPEVFQFLPVTVGLPFVGLYHDQRFPLRAVLRGRVGLYRSERALRWSQGEATPFDHEQRFFFLLYIHLGSAALFFSLVVGKVHAVNQHAEQKQPGEQHGVERPFTHAGDINLFYRLQTIGGNVRHAPPIP